MIPESKTLFILILFTLLLTSCQQNTEDKTSGENPDEIQFYSTENSEFIVKYHDGTKQILSSDGIAYDYHLSPDKDFLAIDYTKFSNLQITKLYKKVSSNRFVEIKNLSTIAWNRYKRDKKIEMDNIINPRSRVININNKTALIQLSGTLEDGRQFSSELEVNLK